MNLQRQLGILRSLVIYYLKPFQIRKMKRFYGSFIQKGDLCFDVGAHVGNRTYVFNHLGAKVICIEPQRNLFDFLKWFFRKEKNINIINRAVGTTEGTAELHTSSSNPTVHTLAEKAWREALDQSKGAAGNWNASESVRLTTLDQLIEEHGLPDFCKIDVEGWEVEVLQGLSQPLPKLSFECLQTANDRAIKCIERLEELDTYSYNLTLGEGMHWVFEEGRKAGDMIRYIREDFPSKKSGDIHAFLN